MNAADFDSDIPERPEARRPGELRLEALELGSRRTFRDVAVTYRISVACWVTTGAMLAGEED